jgi:uncharacterized membrane protein
MKRLTKRGDEGSILPLTMVYGALAFMLILVTMAATSLYLERKRLFTLADGAALAGAEAFPLDTVVLGSDILRPALTSDAVELAAREYLASAPHEPFEGLTITEAMSTDGQSATVTLSAFWRPPMLVLVLPSGIPLEVTSVARSVFW